MKYLFALCLAIFIITIGCEPTQLQPNIIFVLADDLGYGDLGCYGQEMIQTPGLDNMAEEGMLFTRHYAGSTVCAPSRCVLMTGLHTGHCKIRGNAGVPLDEHDTTVAELLKAHGYKTALIGKWGLGLSGSGGEPNLKGFDYFFGYLSQTRAHNYYPEYLWRNGEKVLLKNEVVFASEGHARGIGSASTNKLEYSHDLFTEEAVEYVRQKKDSAFFLYLSYTIPHANNEFELTGAHGMEVPDYGIYESKDWPEPQKGTAAMISRMDRDIGRLLREIRDLGIEDRTVVFFTSDNGPHREGRNDPDFFNSSGSLRGIKRDLYEGGIRVPMIVWGPGTVQAGTRSDYITAFWDFLPTACEIAGIAVPVGIDGISIWPVITGRSQPAHSYLYWEFYEQGGKQAILQDPWKAIRLGVSANLDTSILLYNLSEDPNETVDVADMNREVVRRLTPLFFEARTPSFDFRF